MATGIEQESWTRWFLDITLFTVFSCVWCVLYIGVFALHLVHVSTQGQKRLEIPRD